MTMEAKRWMIIIPLLFLCLFTFASCGSDGKKAKVKVIIVPKFEVGEVSGDYVGEAQLFYDEYTPGAEEIRLPNSPQSARFYFNEDNGAGILVTGEGKMAAVLSLTSLLNCEDYDCSEAMIVSVGCAGGSEGYCTLGDVVLNTAVCDYDLGHRADSRELADPDGGTYTGSGYEYRADVNEDSASVEYLDATVDIEETRFVRDDFDDQVYLVLEMSYRNDSTIYRSEGDETTHFYYDSLYKSFVIQAVQDGNVIEHRDESEAETTEESNVWREVDSGRSLRCEMYFPVEDDSPVTVQVLNPDGEDTVMAELTCTPEDIEEDF